MINFIWCLSLILYLLAFHLCCVFQAYPGPNLRGCKLEMCAFDGLDGIGWDWVAGWHSSLRQTSGGVVGFYCSRRLGRSGRPLPFAGLRETRKTLLMLSFGSEQNKNYLFLWWSCGVGLGTEIRFLGRAEKVLTSLLVFMFDTFLFIVLFFSIHLFFSFFSFFNVENAVPDVGQVTF